MRQNISGLMLWLWNPISLNTRSHSYLTKKPSEYQTHLILIKNLISRIKVSGFSTKPNTLNNKIDHISDVSELKQMHPT
jgi:hypothetical protein